MYFVVIEDQLLTQPLGVGLPSGEAVARHIGIDPLTADQIGMVMVCRDFAEIHIEAYVAQSS